MPEDQGTPPLPPDVRKQQAPPLAQYAEGAMRRDGATPAGGPNQSMRFVLDKLSKIAADMKEIAQVIGVEKPALIPILTRMANMGKTLEQQIQESSQGQGAPAQPGMDPSQGQDAAEGPTN